MPEDRHVIEFGPKFCQAQLDYIFINDISYTNDVGKESTCSHWQRSFAPDINEVVFDLTITEWVNTEEIVFLFAWIYKVLNNKKKATLLLPWCNATMKLNSIFGERRQRYLSSKYGIFFFPDDTEEHRNYNKEKENRRRNLNVSLLTNWQLLNNRNFSKLVIEHKLSEDFYRGSIDYKLNRNTNKVIPFTIIESDVGNETLNFEDVFEEAITKNNLLRVEKELVGILNHHGCYSIFESKVLTNVIFQELFFNTLQHAFKNNEHKICFTGAAFKEETLSTASTEFLDEREPEMLDFFKNKEVIKVKMLDDYIKEVDKQKVLGKIFPDIERRKARLSGHKHLNPMAYIKFTFMDFGIGYTATLKKKFLENKDSLLDKFSRSFSSANEDSQIIEYAFLLETSRNPIDKNMEYYKFVPRGLFFLVDMVRRNKGIIKVRSGHGKVFYDFSDKIYVEIKGGKASVNIHNPYNVSDAVVHSNEKNIPKFEGTMITILLPGKQTKQKRKDLAGADARIVSPVRLENEILNNYIYYKNSDKEKKNLYSVEEITNTKYEFISMVFVFHKAIKEFNESSKLPIIEDLEEAFKIKSFYNYSFSALLKEIKKYTGTNCVIFFDFAELHYTTMVLKVIYYLLETPKINEVTKAVIINLDKVSDSIIAEINTSIMDDTLGPKLFKAIPCLSFIDKNMDPDIKWIGLKDEEDSEVLTKILIGKGLKDRERRLDFMKVEENAEGNVFVEYENKIYSFF